MKFFLIYSLFILINTPLSATYRYDINIDRIKLDDGSEFDRIVIDINPNEVLKFATSALPDDYFEKSIVTKTYSEYIIFHVQKWVTNNYAEHNKLKDPAYTKDLQYLINDYPDPLLLKNETLARLEDDLESRVNNPRIWNYDDIMMANSKLNAFKVNTQDRLNFLTNRKTRLIIFTSPNNINSIWASMLIYETDDEDIYGQFVEKKSHGHNLLLQEEFNKQKNLKKKQGVTQYKLKFLTNYNRPHQITHKKYDFLGAMWETIKEKDMAQSDLELRLLRA